MTAPGFSVIRTQDGSVIAFDPATGLSASGQTVPEALAELRRLVAHTRARAPAGPARGEIAA